VSLVETTREGHVGVRRHGEVGLAFRDDAPALLALFEEARSCPLDVAERRGRLLAQRVGSTPTS
jgi:hypothetical protein